MAYASEFGWIELPYAPTVNHYWGQHGNRRFLTKKARLFRESVARAFNKCNEPELGILHLMIDQRPPDRRKRDIDNLIKPIMDAMEHAGVFENDCQIGRLSVIRGLKQKDGCVFVKLERIEQ